MAPLSPLSCGGPAALACGRLQTAGPSCISIQPQSSSAAASRGPCGRGLAAASRRRCHCVASATNGSTRPASPACLLDDADNLSGSSAAPRLSRSEAAVAAVAEAAASYDGDGEVDAVQLDAAIAAALKRVAATIAAEGAPPGAQQLEGSQLAAAPAAMRAEIDEGRLHQFIESEVHLAFEHEMQGISQAVHTAVEAEMREVKSEVKEAMGEREKMALTANVNTLMAITAIISYWRGVTGLLDILLEDSLEGFVFCTVFGFGIIGLIRRLKLPVVEGGGGFGGF